MRLIILLPFTLFAILLLVVQPAKAQTGACCRDFDGTCTEGVASADCAGFSQRFIDGGTCADFGDTCGVGACCTPTGCIEATRTICLTSAGGFFWRPGACDGLDCGDCDGDSRPDALEIESLPSLDCNQNGLLDTCEIDPADGAPGGPYFCTTGDCAVDCNNNGIPDECEIYEYTSAPGGPYYCPDNCAADCNNNGIPDECDIDAADPDGNGEVSDDLIAPIGVPDECRMWVGTVNDLWSEANNWMPPTVPNNSPTEKFSVVIDGSVDGPSAVVEADGNVIISSLILRDMSTLTLTEQSLSIDGKDGIINEGVLVVPEGHSLNALDSFRIRGNGGVIQLDGDDARLTSGVPGALITNEVEVQGRGVVEANFRNASTGSVRANDPGPMGTSSLQITGLNTINNGALIAELAASLHIFTSVTEEPNEMSSISALGATVVIGDGDDGDDPDTVDGCGPIVLSPLDRTVFRLNRARLINFTLWRIGDNALTGPTQTALFELVNGSSGLVMGPVLVKNNGTLTLSESDVDAESFLLDGGATLSVDADSSLTVRGAFQSMATDESLISFSSGSELIFEGGTRLCGGDAWERTLEAASMNLGAASGGGGYENNFDFATLRLAAGANVSLVDAIDNGNRPADGSEAVYCDTLIIESGATLFLNGISLFVGGVQIAPGPFGAGVVVDVAACCLPTNTCTNEIPDCCVALNGEPNASGIRCSGVLATDCPPDPGAPPTGACCLPNETCLPATTAGCAGLNGAYQGNGADCAAVDCSASPPSPVPTGACCFLDESCDVRTAANCTASNGEYLGDDTDCTESNCPPIEGQTGKPQPINQDLLDEAFCRLVRRALCGVPECAPCLIGTMATMVGIRRMRRRRWQRKSKSKI